MGTYSIEEQRRMDAIDLTEGKRGAGHVVSIRLEEYKALKDALREIRDSPHCSYESEGQGASSLSYATGVVDGHRCAANIARTALALVKENDQP